MVDQQIQDRLENNYAALIMDYASGTLDQAQSLIVAAHVALSPDAQKRLCACEDIGGALLQECCDQESPMSDGCLESLMSKIDTQKSVTQSPETHKPAPSFPKGNTCKNDHLYKVPEIVRGCLCPEQTNKWQSLMGGFEKMILDLPCKQSEAKFIAAAPGAKSPTHTHGGMEITLVLDGAFSDQTGHYKRGDLIVTDGEIEHQISACPDMGCMCMVVTTAPIKFTGIAKLLNPFVKL